MLKRPIIEKQYITRLREIHYFGESDKPEKTGVFHNHGHLFQFAKQNEEELSTLSEKFEVAGWIAQTLDCPYDFILKDVKTDRYYLAVLGKRTDGWPLLSVQDEGYVCARSRMGSEWNCRYCIKFFGTACQRR